MGLSFDREPVPFFESPGTAQRRLLLISYSFPPDTSVGALRWKMMLRAGAELGWSADVLMLHPDGPYTLDYSQLELLGPGIRLFGVAMPRTPLDYVLSWRRVIRRRLSPTSGENGDRPPLQEVSQSAPKIDTGTWPGRIKSAVASRNSYRRWAGWARRAASIGVRLARSRSYACVASSGPPHMAHVAGRLVAQATGLPLILDFRDPWTTDDVAPRSQPVWRALSERHELRCVRAASLIVANTPSSTREFQRKYPAMAARVVTVLNGADEPLRTASPSARPFVIAHVGSLYGGRDPGCLIRGVAAVVRAKSLSAEELTLCFLGASGQQCTELGIIAAAEGLSDHVRCQGRVPHAAAVSFLDDAAMLVLLPQVHGHSIPAKFFEYVQRRAWILALTEPTSAMGELLEGSGADVVMPDDTSAVASIIARRFDEARRGQFPAPLNQDGRFDRGIQVRTLFSAIDRVLSGGVDAAVGRAPHPTPAD